MLEADAFSQSLGHRRVGTLSLRGGVILQPGEAFGTLEPDAAQEADLAHGAADVSREARARRQHQQHLAGWGR